MSNLRTRQRTLILIVRAAAIIALLTWFAHVATALHFDNTRPIQPSAESGRTIPHNNHGHIVYLTHDEEHRLLVLREIPIGLALIAIVVAYFAKKNQV
jgi:hypothetical protein